MTVVAIGTRPGTAPGLRGRLRHRRTLMAGWAQIVRVFMLLARNAQRMEAAALCLRPEPSFLRKRHRRSCSACAVCPACAVCRLPRRVAGNRRVGMGFAQIAGRPFGRILRALLRRSARTGGAAVSRCGSIGAVKRRSRAGGAVLHRCDGSFGNSGCDTIWIFRSTVRMRWPRPGCASVAAPVRISGSGMPGSATNSLFS